VRIEWIDTAKFLGLLLVILGHHGISGVNGTFYFAFHMPLFFWINGYLYKQPRSFTDAVKRGIKKYIIPYAVGSMIAIIFCRYLREKVFIDWLKLTDWSHDPFYIFKVSFGYWEGWSLFWFLPCLFMTNLLMFFVKKITDKKSVFFSAIILVLFGIAGMVLSYSFERPIFFQLNNALVALVFTYIGYISSKQDIKVNKIFKIGMHIVLLFVYCVAIHKKIYINMGLSEYPYFPICILSAIGGIYVFIFIVKLLPKNQIIAFWGRNSLIVYIVHAIEHNFIPWSDIKIRSIQMFCEKQVLADFFTYIVRVVIILSISIVIIEIKKHWIAILEKMR